MYLSNQKDPNRVKDYRMTQTLRRERIQKFTEILVEFKVSPYDYAQKPQLILPWLDNLAEALADASLSRTEKSEKPEIMDGILESEAHAQPQMVALLAFEAAFKIENGNIPWFKNRPEWTRLRKKLVEKYQSDPEYFKKYLIWYNEAGKFAGGMNMQQLRRDPDGFVLALNIFDATQTVGIPQKSDMLEETQKKIESEDWRKRA
jgi:hypothetical protein